MADTPTTQPLPAAAGDKPKQKHLGKTKRELTARAKLILQEIINGATEAQALKKAGYSAGYVSSQREAILSNPTLQHTFQACLDRAGVTDDKIADRLDKLIDAKSLKRFGKENIEIDDNGTQLGAVQLAAKLRGHMVEQRGSGEVHLTFIDLSGYGQSGASMAPMGRDEGKVVDVTPDQIQPTT